MQLPFGTKRIMRKKTSELFLIERDTKDTVWMITKAARKSNKQLKMRTDLRNRLVKTIAQSRRGTHL